MAQAKNENTAIQRDAEWVAATLSDVNRAMTLAMSSRDDAEAEAAYQFAVSRMPEYKIALRILRRGQSQTPLPKPLGAI